MSAPIHHRHAPLSRRDWLRRSAAIAGAGLLLPRFTLGEAAGTSPLTVHTQVPLNAETPLDRLVERWITPTELFYVRSHAPNPEIDLDAFRLTVDGLVDRPLSLSLAELTDRFANAEVTATMCCAGNRREEHSRIKPVDGVQWGGGALGNATWGGVSLADVLRHAGLKDSAQHVWFEGLDAHEKKGQPIVFGGSIPIDRALADDPQGQALICHRMNGQPLTPDHGAPLRTVVPGYIGARSVKWLSRIHVSDRPSDNYYVQHAYRLIDEDTPAAWEQADILYELPLQSVICTATEVLNKRRTRLSLKGYALPPGDRGRTIARVEVSLDNGTTWTAAKLDSQPRPYCWQFWSAEVRHRKPAERALVRAIDSEWTMQPEKAVWNAKGYMFNAWHARNLSDA